MSKPSWIILWKWAVEKQSSPLWSRSADLIDKCDSKQDIFMNQIILSGFDKRLFYKNRSLKYNKYGSVFPPTDENNLFANNMRLRIILFSFLTRVWTIFVIYRLFITSGSHKINTNFDLQAFGYKSGADKLWVQGSFIRFPSHSDWSIPAFPCVHVIWWSFTSAHTSHFIRVSCSGILCVF